MNKKQRKALEESIAHWERMRDDPDCEESPSGWNCACCTYSNSTLVDGGSTCDNCPISEFTGKTSCDGTPYDKAYDYYERGSSSKMFKRWAQKEIDFLNKVLEAG